MSKNFIMGSLYEITFYDHCTGQDDTITCKTAGWVIKETKDYVVLSYWVVDTEDEEIRSNNLEPTTIVKSCITKKRKLA